MIRLGLCCGFVQEPIKFRTTTVKAAMRLTTEKRHRKLAKLCRENAHSLRKAIEYCHAHNIGCFRVNSQILPLKTHSECGYEVDTMPDGTEIIEEFQHCGRIAKQHDIRLAFHPDQFVVLSSPREDVVENSIAELEYQSEVAEWIGADCVNIHGGGAYGDKPAALARFAKNLGRLSDRVRSRLTIENDDKIYSAQDLLPFCRQEGLPLVYDVHHHRCHADELTVADATTAAMETWDREPLFHISSPLEGWSGPKPQRHHDYVDIQDMPEEWRLLNITVEVEAKAKELAVLQLQRTLDEV